MKLFGATIGAVIKGPQEEVVMLPRMSTEFLDIFGELSATNTSRSFRSHLERHALNRNGSLLFLKKQTDLPHLSQAAGFLFICYNWKKDPLDENFDAMTHKLGIVTYLPPPYKSQSKTSREYSEYVSKSKNVEFVEDMGNVWDKWDKIATKAFIQGRQCSIYDILATITNLGADLSFHFSYNANEALTIVNMIFSIVNRMSKNDFMKW